MLRVCLHEVEQLKRMEAIEGFPDQSHQKRKKVTCFCCKRRGHIKKDCPKLQEKEAKGKKIVTGFAKDSDGLETVLSMTVGDVRSDSG